MGKRKKILASLISLSLATAFLSDSPFTSQESICSMLSSAQAENSTQHSDRTVVLVGNLQVKSGATKDWDPADTKTAMKSIGNGFYSLTLDLPSGTYYYKIAINGSWNENYGLDGNHDGANIQLNLSTPQKVTFYYNDITHKISDSTIYQMPKDSDLPMLEGNFGVDIGDKYLRDLTMDNLFQKELTLKAGNYQISLNQGGKKIAYQEINVPKDGKVNFYYDATTKKFFIDDGSLHEDKIFHDTWSNSYRLPFEAVKVGSSVKLSVATKNGDAKNVKLILCKSKISTAGGDEFNPNYLPADAKSFPMKLERTENGQDIWSTHVKLDEVGIYGYKFLINDTKEYGDDAKPGHTGEVKIRGTKYFQLTVYSADFHTPNWAKEAVIYQIFPDRFFNGDPSNDNARQMGRGHYPIKHRTWNELPINYSKSPELTDDKLDCNDFFGGDLAGITKKLDYLQSLGVNAIYVNPIMNACSNHRYDTVDYENLDPLLGTLKDFQTLTAEMKKRNMYLIMDGVFNHVGDDSVYFDRYSKYPTVGAYEFWSRVYDLENDKHLSETEAKKIAKQQLIAEGQKFSPYHWENWFEIRNEKTSDEMGEKYAYHDWQGFSSLAPFNNDDYLGKNNATLGKYLLSDKDAVLTRWFKYGLSGWRMDVAKEVPPEFWVNVRKEIKKIKLPNGEEPLMISEIWQDGSQFLMGEQFDSVMNYKLAFAINDLFLLNGDPKAADEEITVLRQNYPKEAFYTLMNFVDSHDVARAIYRLGGGKDSVIQAKQSDFDYNLGKARLKLAMTFIAGYPGMPTIFYGDEVGLFGSADPDCRRTYSWGNEDTELLNYYKKIIGVRNANKKLFVHGDVLTLKADGDIYAYLRQNDSDAAIVVLNRGKSQKVEINVAQLPNGTKFIDKLSGKEVTVSNGKIIFDADENQAFMFLK